MEMEMGRKELERLLEEKQYKKLRRILSEMNEADIAAIMDDMEDEDSLKIFRILPKGIAADVFALLEVEDQRYIIMSLSTSEASRIVDNLMADDATDLLEEMPANIVKKILANASPETRSDINHLLQYPDSSAGSIMTVEYVDLKKDMTVQEAITRVRVLGLDSETVNVCYVLDRKRLLVGTVALRYLLIKQPGEIIGDIMNENVISIKTSTDQEEAARMFQKYDFTTMPVVDNENRLVGIITVDDVMDIMEEEATEDIEKMAAMIPSDKPYFRVGILETFRNRMPWLLVLMVSATFTGAIISRYENALASYVLLTAYIPMLMDTGGNAGSQSSTSVIRGLSLREIEFKDFFSVLWKEGRVAILCGAGLAAANFVKLLLFDHLSLLIAAIICMTLVMVVIFAKLVGAALPMLADRIHLDPTVMASPLITTIVDTVSLWIYFQLVTVFLLHRAG
ncbi:magnesium transporter [Oribacterium sp. oral taxon 102]|uniref:magnesium transporter n=1 Tax=Oribacterium sp. oral taxon 102 TaxID=671214 RepID=UPI002ED421F7